MRVGLTCHNNATRPTVEIRPIIPLCLRQLVSWRANVIAVHQGVSTYTNSATKQLSVGDVGASCCWCC